jgi:hypothetical protein
LSVATAEVQVSARIAESADTVWAAATDWARQGEWMVGTEVHVLGGDGGLGSRLAAFTGIGGVGVLDTMDIVEWRPPVCCRVRHVGKLIVGHGGFRVIRDAPHTCTFLWWERLELPAVGAVAWPWMRPAVRWGLARSLRRFAAFCPRYREEKRGG